MVTVIVLLAACSQDVVEEQTQESDAHLRLGSVTRAITDDTEYGDIRVFLTNGTTATEGLFKYGGGEIMDDTIEVEVRREDLPVIWLYA